MRHVVLHLVPFLVFLPLASEGCAADMDTWGGADEETELTKSARSSSSCTSSRVPWGPPRTKGEWEVRYTLQAHPKRRPSDDIDIFLQMFARKPAREKGMEALEAMWFSDVLERAPERTNFWSISRSARVRSSVVFLNVGIFNGIFAVSHRSLVARQPATLLKAPVFDCTRLVERLER